MFNMPYYLRWIFLAAGTVLFITAGLDSFTNHSVAFLSYFVFPYSLFVGIALFIIGYGISDEKEDGGLENTDDNMPGFRVKKDGFFSGNDSGGDGGGGD